MLLRENNQRLVWCDGDLFFSNNWDSKIFYRSYICDCHVPVNLWQYNLFCPLCLLRLKCLYRDMHSTLPSLIIWINKAHGLNVKYIDSNSVLFLSWPWRLHRGVKSCLEANDKEELWPWYNSTLAEYILLIAQCSKESHGKSPLLPGTTAIILPKAAPETPQHSLTANSSSLFNHFYSVWLCTCTLEYVWLWVHRYVRIPGVCVSFSLLHLQTVGMG